MSLSPPSAGISRAAEAPTGPEAGASAPVVQGHGGPAAKPPGSIPGGGFEIYGGPYRRRRPPRITARRR